MPEHHLAETREVSTLNAIGIASKCSRPAQSASLRFCTGEFCRQPVNLAYLQEIQKLEPLQNAFQVEAPLKAAVHCNYSGLGFGFRG